MTFKKSFGRRPRTSIVQSSTLSRSLLRVILPIYALSGPSGKLFKPMADTVAIALVGALILTLTLVPVLCAYWFKKGVHERENKPFNWVRDRYAVQLEWCLNHPKTTMIGATLIFAATLLLIPFIGGEFMPHLDEGALWVRATMPYTVSFETASNFSPQVRNILLKYPMVTEVGSELGRPDDGTDPTGFFNDEFYVGLKPYSDASWKTGSVHTKAELTERYPEAAQRISRSHLQLHSAGRRRSRRSADGPEERAGCKDLWPRPECSPEPGARNQAQAFASAWIRGTDRGARTRPAQPLDRCGSRQDCALRHQRGGRRGDRSGRRWRPGGYPGDSGRESSSISWCA